MQQLIEQFADHDKDTKLNIKSVLTEEGSEGLTLKQIYGISLAAAYSVKEKNIISAILSDAQDILDPNEIQAAKIAATIMAMNNVYYRFIHEVHDKEYSKLPAKLRMNMMANPGVEKHDFELYSLAVSAINGCSFCMDTHASMLVKAGVSKVGIQSCIKIAAVVNSVAQINYTK